MSSICDSDEPTVRFSELPPELVALVCQLGILSTADVLELACASKDLYDKALGSEWAKTCLQYPLGFEWCCKHGTAMSVKWWQTKPKQAPQVSTDILQIASRNNPEALRALFELGKIDRTGSANACLVNAVTHNAESMRVVLTWCSDKDHYAYNLEHSDTLCDADCRWVDPTKDSHRAFSLAAKRNPESLRVLFKSSVCPWTPTAELSFLAAKHQPESLRLLIAWCSDKEHLAYNMEHSDTLCTADCERAKQVNDMVRTATKHQPKALRLLLENGNCLGMDTRLGKQCWFIAARFQPESLRLLMAQDADGDDRFTPTIQLLKHASLHNKESALILLEDGRALPAGLRSSRLLVVVGLE